MRRMLWGALIGLAALGSSAAIAQQQIAFGGIELASSSVKGLTFVFQPGSDAAAGTGGRPERMKRLQYAERNASFISMRDGCKLNERGVALLVKDTSEVIDELRDGAKAQDLGQLQLFVVGSSGLGSVCNTDEIAAKVQAATGLCTEFISSSDEAKYTLGFVLPRDRYRSLVVDISGGNTLGGYYVTTRGAEWPPREWHGFEIKYGSRTLKDKALALMKQERKDEQGKAMAPLDFYGAVDQVLRNEVEPELDQIKEENSGIENFGQVYMVGGAVWAVSTRERPVQQEEWAINLLTVADFDTVLAKIKDGTYKEYEGNEFPPHTSQKTRDAAQGELQDVLTRFDPESMYAGVALAKFIIEQTTPSARVYFPTTAAWISGYAREKFREGGKSVASCAAPGANKATATAGER
jgi:hypothetical protein